MKLTVLHDQVDLVASSSPLNPVMKGLGNSNVCFSQLASHAHPLVAQFFGVAPPGQDQGHGARHSPPMTAETTSASLGTCNSKLSLIFSHMYW